MINDEATHPGFLLIHLIENANVLPDELAKRADVPLKTVNKILQGRAPITPAFAEKIEGIIMVPAPVLVVKQSFYNLVISERKNARISREVNFVVWLNVGLSVVSLLFAHGIYDLLIIAVQLSFLLRCLYFVLKLRLQIRRWKKERVTLAEFVKRYEANAEKISDFKQAYNAGDNDKAKEILTEIKKHCDGK